MEAILPSQAALDTTNTHTHTHTHTHTLACGSSWGVLEGFLIEVSPGPGFGAQEVGEGVC